MEKGSINLLTSIVCLLMVGYGLMMNVALGISILISVSVSLFIGFLLEIGDKDIMDSVINDKELDDKIIKKFSSCYGIVLCFCFVLTILIYRFLENCF